MKFGVLGFTYAGSAAFARQCETTGHYTVNLGDNAQTIASRHVYRSLGVDDRDMVLIDRDTLPEYAGEPAFLIMNGVFRDRHFPLPETITPIFVGFCAKSVEVVSQNLEMFRRHQPIGCRDLATVEHFRSFGIRAHATGCVTMTLPRRTKAPEQTRLLVVHGTGAGLLPPAVLKHIPDALMDTAEFIFHRLPVAEHPLSSASSDWIERYEAHLLQRYAATATVVLTPLLHVASPCIGMGVPVVLCRKNLDSRFGYLAERMPIHTPQTLTNIDWNPAPLIVEPEAARILQEVRQALSPSLAQPSCPEISNMGSDPVAEPKTR